MIIVDIGVGLVIAIGLVGIILPVLPGALLVLAAVVGWGVAENDRVGWVVVGLAAGCLLLAQVLKYLIPGRRLHEQGVPTATLVVGALLAIVGFFVIPVIGLVFGFVVGVYAAERYRLHDHHPAAASTVVAVRAMGLSILIELAGTLVAAGVWLVGAFIS